MVVDLGRDMMGLNWFRGGKQEGCFCSNGGGDVKTQLWVGCGRVRLGDGFGNGVIDQWESEQIGGLAFC